MGSLVDLLYRTDSSVVRRYCQLAGGGGENLRRSIRYNPLFAAPFGVLTYEWKNNGISLHPVRELVRWKHYRDKIIPTLLATWAVWIPLMAIIYSLPRFAISLFG